jgi:nitroimidazol reductase NimA-like FMN-containing flavoprotein (pyridoxamine 5'-phosphate oxidase superfamily)
MTAIEPVSAELLTTDAATVIPWSEAQTRLAQADSYWIATVRSDGQPHVRPVLAVWVDGSLFASTGPRTSKGRNLARDPRCAITVASEGIDLVVEGHAKKVRDEAKLRLVADAYASKYEWLVTVRSGAFHDADGAPTAGPPPYEVFEVIPSVVFGFGTDESFAPRSTRWQF